MHLCEEALSHYEHKNISYNNGIKNTLQDSNTQSWNKVIY